MGCDLLLAWHPWPIGMDGQDLHPDRLRDRLTADINDIAHDNLVNVYLDLHGEEPGEWITVTPRDEPDAEDTVFQVFDGISPHWDNETKDRLIEAVEHLLDGGGLINDAEMEGRTYFLAGGSSYGDDPNREFRSLSILVEAALLYDERPRHGFAYVTVMENGWPTVAIGPFDDRYHASIYLASLQKRADVVAAITDDPRNLPIEAPVPAQESA